MTDKNYPETATEPLSRSTVLDGVDTHIVEVTRYDQNDVVVGRQYMALFLEDATDGRFVCSNITSSLPGDDL